MSNPPFLGKVPKMDVIYMTRRQTPECERVSTCCGAPEHSDVENFCAQCRDGTGFECNVHEVEWGEGECPAKEKVG